LYLRWDSIGENGAQALTDAIGVNSTLAILYLYGNSIPSDQARVLTEALRTKPTPTILDMDPPY